MNILHVLDERWDSGLTAYGLNAAEMLLRRGHRVSVAAHPGRFAFEEAKKRGLPVFPLRGFLSLRRCVSREKIEVVNAFTGSGHTLSYGAVLGRRVVLVRSRGEARQVRRRWGQGVILRRTQALVAASEVLAEECRRVFPQGPAVTLIVPSVEVREIRPLPSGPLRWGVVGRLDPIKGHDMILQALSLARRLVPDITLALAGRACGVSYEQIRGWAEKWGVTSAVEILGPVDDVREFMGGCQGGIIGSRGSEAVSRVALEWLSVGRGVVATAVGCLPEIISSEVGVLVPPGSAEGLAQALVQLSQDRPLRESLGRAAMQKVQTLYSEEKLGKAWENLYDGLIRQAARP